MRSLSLGVGADTRDDVFNPRRGVNVTISDEVSNHALGSAFNYNAHHARRREVLPDAQERDARHPRARRACRPGAIPTNKLFIFSDQDLRGYSDPFYGTDMLLGQLELRVPLTPDRKFSIVLFVDDGGTRIRGGTSEIDASDMTTTTTTSTAHVPRRRRASACASTFRSSGLRTLRLDFAKGSQGAHTSFGIGQSF